VNVTNSQTYLDTYLSDDLLVGRGNGTIATLDGQNISWISSGLGKFIDNQWIFYGVMLFNNTHSESIGYITEALSLFDISIKLANDIRTHLTPQYKEAALALP